MQRANDPAAGGRRNAAMTRPSTSPPTMASLTTESVLPSARARSVVAVIPRRLRVSRREAILWLLGIGGAVLAAWFSVWSTINVRTALIVAMATVTVLPVLVRLIWGRFDALEYIFVFAVGIGVIFLGRPITELTDNIQTYAGYFTRSGFNGAMMIGIVGTASLYLGYFLPIGRKWGEAAQTPSSRWDADLSVRVAIRLVVLGTVLYLLYAATGGGGITNSLKFFIGRGSTNTSLQGSSGWLYLGPYLTLPASALLMSAWQRQRTRRNLVLLVITVMIGLLITVPRGDRTYVLALVMPLLVLPSLYRRRRPRLLTILVTTLVGIVAINFLLVYRNLNTRSNANSALSSAITDPLSPIHSLLAGPDVSFFSVLELQDEVQPREVHFHPGATPLSILAGPIPMSLWHNKPQAAAVPVAFYLFYTQSLISRASNDPAMFGDFYADYGFPTLILYSILLGIGLRALYVYLRRHEHLPGAQLVFASSLPLMIILLRGAITDTLARSVVLLFPLIIAWYVCSRTPGQRAWRPRRGSLVYRRPSPEQR